jgi:four helix bundle protein
MFIHEKFKAYQSAIAFLAIAETIVSRISAGHRPLVDQLRRAALSVPLNIAEGTGKRTRRDRDRYYWIARGSAMECAALLDALAVMNLAESEVIAEGKRLLNAVVGILTKVCQAKKTGIETETGTGTEKTGG